MNAVLNRNQILIALALIHSSLLTKLPMSLKTNENEKGNREQKLIERRYKQNEILNSE